MSGRAAIVGMWLVISCASGALAQESAPGLRGMLTPDTALQDYEWIEHTVVTLRGEDRIRRQERCFYGEDATIPRRVPIPPDADEEKRRKAVKFTKADAETLQMAGSRMAQYVVALQAAMDSAFAADSTLRRARTGQLKFKAPFKGEELVFEAVGMESRMYVYEGEGDTRHEVVTMKIRYATIDGHYVPIRQTVEMSRYALTTVSEKSGFKKRRG